MVETLHLCFHSTLLPVSKPHHPTTQHHQLTPKLPITPHTPPPPPPPNPPHSLLLLQHPSPRTSTPTPTPRRSPIPSSFREKILFLDSLDVDLPSLLRSHPSSVLTSLPLPHLRSIVHFLRNPLLNLSPTDLRRVLSICPDILACPVSSLAASVSFLLREAKVKPPHLRRAVSRRPRLLVSDVPTRLRPTLYFLHSLGLPDVPRHTYLLSCSVEDKLLPRIHFLERSGFAPREARSMVRRFPPIFCYSSDQNLSPKLDYLVGAMGRELDEVRNFPQYFSYSLEKRIRRRHEACEQRGVRFTLPALLRPSDEEFEARVGVCVGSSPPLRSSPLWYGNSDSVR